MPAAPVVGVRIEDGMGCVMGLFIPDDLVPQDKPAAPAGGMSAVFAQLSKIDQSSGKTAGLRHVTKVRMVVRVGACACACACGHRRYVFLLPCVFIAVIQDMKSKGSAGSAGAAGAPKKAAAKPKAAAKKFAAAPAKPPMTKLVASTWRVEHHVKPAEVRASARAGGGAIWLVCCLYARWRRAPQPIVIEHVTVKQKVYIYNCTDTTIIIKGKLNTLGIDRCTRCNVICDTILATAE
jgi:hypothetical protein